jgi:hypothetical protein
MKIEVTEHGVTIPADMLAGAEAVEVHQENGTIVLRLISSEDPILGLGRNPVACGLSDASTAHDRYLYDPAP